MLIALKNLDTLEIFKPSLKNKIKGFVDYFFSSLSNVDDAASFILFLKIIEIFSRRICVKFFPTLFLLSLKYLKVPKILVTGSVGFIGFHTTRLLQDGNEVMGIDNLNDYYDPNLKLKRLEFLKSLP